VGRSDPIRASLEVLRLLAPWTAAASSAVGMRSAPIHSIEVRRSSTGAASLHSLLVPIRGDPSWRTVRLVDVTNALKGIAMSTIGWVILWVLLIPVIGVLVFVLVMASLVRIPSGTLGLVMKKGQATDTALLPGSHFLPALRRRMVEEYPSTELAYRAGGRTAWRRLGRTGGMRSTNRGRRTGLSTWIRSGHR